MFLKKCQKSNLNPKITLHLSVFDYFPILYLLIRAIPDSTFLVYTIK